MFVCHSVTLSVRKNHLLNSSFIINRRKLILIPIDCKFCPPWRGGVKNAILSTGTRLGGGNLFCINDTRPTDGYTTVTQSICFIYSLVNMVILYTRFIHYIFNGVSNKVLKVITFSSNLIERSIMCIISALLNLLAYSLYMFHKKIFRKQYQ